MPGSSAHSQLYALLRPCSLEGGGWLHLGLEPSIVVAFFLIFGR